MKHDYAKIKLECLLRDLNNYTADEFRRQMMRIASGATGENIPDDAHTIKAELDALVAQVEALKDAANFAYCNWRSSSDALGGMRRLVDAVDSTPAQCLAEIRAEAGRAGYLQAIYDYEQIFEIDCNMTPENAADKYADKIRQGGVK
jgi:hypothetical protein